MYGVKNVSSLQYRIHDHHKEYSNTKTESRLSKWVTISYREKEYFDSSIIFQQSSRITDKGTIYLTLLIAN